MTSILTGIAGAVLSAPAAALEALSPTAAAKTSDGVAFVSSKLPSMSLEDATNSAQNLAGSAYNAVPEGTAATLRGYADAAIHKAQEILPPAFGGSPVSLSFYFIATISTYKRRFLQTRGNAGTGELAKSPNQIASECTSSSQLSSQDVLTFIYVCSDSQSASQTLSNAVGNATACKSRKPHVLLF